MPAWFPKGIMSRAESWVVEESEVDPNGRTVRCVTRNLDHVKVMQVIEETILEEAEDGYAGTLQGVIPKTDFPTICRNFQAHITIHQCSIRFEIWLGNDKTNREIWNAQVQSKH